LKKFRFCPNSFENSGEILTLEKFGHFGNFMLPENFGQVIMVEERFHFCPNVPGVLEKS
jgi:hypothetical protein